MSAAGCLVVAPAGAAWLQPPPVLPVPSRTGPEGPPRPYGAEPRVGADALRTGPRLLLAQNRALLYGPFPHGGLERGISDAALLMSPDAGVRARALGLMRSAGARIVRIPVEWRYIVSADPPAGFDARDPASPAYDFDAVDAAVRDTVAAGLEPLLVVTRAPAWAEAPDRWRYAYPGGWAPDPVAFGEFAAAVARRYDGAFPDPLRPGRPLPRVRLLQAWNEPNLARYLEPQWIAAGGRWRAFSPALYRELLNAFYASIEAVAPGDVAIAAGIAPDGDPPGVGRMAPLRFLGEMLCLGDAGGGSAGGTAAGARRPRRPAHRGRAGSCADPPHFDVLAFHPLSFQSPDRAAASAADVSIADVAKVTALLARAERAGTALPRAHKPLWVTELNWESAPPAAHGVPGRLQAPWISRALHRLWVAGVAVAEWQFLVDPDPGVTLATPTGGTVRIPRPAGLYSPGPGGALTGARPKPFLRGFELPFDPLRVDRRRVRVWGLLGRPRQAVLLQRAPARGRGRWTTVARLRADGAGVVNALVRMRGAAVLRFRAGALDSAEARVPSARGRL